MAQWTWAAASRRGSSHVAAGERRQDSFGVLAPDCDAHLVAVAADGAGSASHGGEGASIAVWTLKNAAASWFRAEGRPPGRDRLTTWMALVRLRIAAAAFSRGLEVRDFATTAVLVIADRGGATVMHVGDGAAVARSSTSGLWTTLSWPEQGEYASTTCFVTDDALSLRIASHRSDIDRFAVMTDGLERLALDFSLNAPHARFFDGVAAPLLAEPNPGLNRGVSDRLGEYLDSDRVVERTNDDKTLIVAALV